jgi:ABC-type Na+ efflux pump permease subunit
MGKIFSYITPYNFITFFVIPIPFGIYFIALIIYFLMALFLLIQSIKGKIEKRGLIISFIILIGAIGSSIIFIGE